MLTRLGYNRNVPLEYNQKRICGLWLAIIGVNIIVSTYFGGDFEMNPLIFMIVYGLAFYLSFMNPHIQKRLSQGPTSAFQDKMGKYGDLSLVVLIILIAGPFIPSFDWRMIWLGALLATGIHFFIFYFVHGASMIVIGILCTLIAAAGMMMKDVPFEFFGFADGGVKLIIGCYLLFWSRPTRS